MRFVGTTVQNNGANVFGTLFYCTNTKIKNLGLKYWKYGPHSRITLIFKDLLQHKMSILRFQVKPSVAALTFFSQIKVENCVPRLLPIY